MYLQIVKKYGANLPDSEVNSIAKRWSIIPSNKFVQERAIMCLAISQGAWTEIRLANFDQAIAHKTPILAALKNYLGEVIASQTVCEIVAYYAMMLNVGKNLQKHQIASMAELLLLTYGHMTVSDFKLALQMGVTGKFGTTYDRFDIEVICSWCEKYWNERIEHAESKSIVRHSEQKSEEMSGVNMPEWFGMFVKSFVNKHIAQEREFTPDSAIIESWRDEWMRLDENERPLFDSYCKLQTLKLKRSLTV